MRENVFHYLGAAEIRTHWLCCVGGLMAARAVRPISKVSLNWPGLSDYLHELLGWAEDGSENALTDAKTLALLMALNGGAGVTLELEDWITAGRAVNGLAEFITEAVERAREARPQIIYLPKAARSIARPLHRGNLDACLDDIEHGACSLGVLGAMLQGHGDADLAFDWPLFERMVRRRLPDDARLLERVRRCARLKPHTESAEDAAWATVGSIVLGLATALRAHIGAAHKATPSLFIYSDPKAATRPAEALQGQGTDRAESAARGEG